MKRIFRQKSIDKLRSPDQLDEYLHAEGPGMWLVLIAVVLVLGGILVWGFLASTESYVHGKAAVEDGTMTFIPEDEYYSSYMKEGLVIISGEHSSEITAVGEDEEGRTFAVANSDLPDGIYSAKIGYDSTHILELMF